MDTYVRKWVMYAEYRDKPKAFIDILIRLDDTTEYGKLFRIATACQKRRKTVCTSQRLYKGKRMCLSSEVICAMFEHKGYILEVNQPMNNLVQMAHF